MVLNASPSGPPSPSQRLITVEPLPNVFTCALGDGLAPATELPPPVEQASSSAATLAVLKPKTSSPWTKSRREIWLRLSKRLSSLTRSCDDILDPPQFG